MSVKPNPATSAGSQPGQSAYSGGVAGQEASSPRHDGGENVRASYNPDAERSSGNLAFGVVAIVAFIIFIVLYVQLMSRL